MIRFRWPVLGLWLAVLVVGFGASTQLSKLLSNTFTVPGTDSEIVRTTLEQHFGDRSDGAFTVVFQVRDAAAPGLKAELSARVTQAAHVIPTAQAAELRVASKTVLYQDVTSSLQLAEAEGYTYALRDAIGAPDGVRVYVTGAAAIQRDLDPIFASDLRTGESIALPIALAVLIAVFGLSWAVGIPFLFAAATIFGTLGLVYLFAHETTIATYSTNLVQLIGLGIAVDYSLLIVYRFREELERGLDRTEAVSKKAETGESQSGRKTILCPSSGERRHVVGAANQPQPEPLGHSHSQQSYSPILDHGPKTTFRRDQPGMAAVVERMVGVSRGDHGRRAGSR